MGPRLLENGARSLASHAIGPVGGADATRENSRHASCCQSRNSPIEDNAGLARVLNSAFTQNA